MCAKHCTASKLNYKYFWKPLSGCESVFTMLLANSSFQVLLQRQLSINCLFNLAK